MTHAVSLTFTRFERMSPPAAGMALLLHALVAFLLWWAAPVHGDDMAADAIEVTMEAPPPPPPQPVPETPKPPPPAPAAKPAPPPPIGMRGLPPPAPTGPKTEGAGTPREESPRAKPVEKVEEPAPEKTEAPQQAVAPPPPPAPTLEKLLPPVEIPAAPVTSRDIPKPAPPPPEPRPPPKPPQPAQPPRPPPPQTGLAPSPLSRLPPRGAPPPSTRQDPGPPPSPFVNPADARARNTVAEAYLQQVNYKISQQIFAPSSAEELGLVVGVRFTIARDGRLLDISVARASGSPGHDSRIIGAFRAAAPFPPLPAELPGDSATFVLPIGTRVAR